MGLNLSTLSDAFHKVQMPRFCTSVWKLEKSSKMHNDLDVHLN